jgi:hypothetical protein
VLSRVENCVSTWTSCEFSLLQNVFCVVYDTMIVWRFLRLGQKGRSTWVCVREERGSEVRFHVLRGVSAPFSLCGRTPLTATIRIFYCVEMLYILAFDLSSFVCVQHPSLPLPSHLLWRIIAPIVKWYDISFPSLWLYGGETAGVPGSIPGGRIYVEGRGYRVRG